MSFYFLTTFSGFSEKIVKLETLKNFSRIIFVKTESTDSVPTPNTLYILINPLNGKLNENQKKRQKELMQYVCQLSTLQ